MNFLYQLVFLNKFFQSCNNDNTKKSNQTNDKKTQNDNLKKSNQTNDKKTKTTDNLTKN